MREQAVIDKERNLVGWRGGKSYRNDEDQFEKLVKEEQKKRKQEGVDLNLKKKADDLASDIERDSKKYSDIDMIYEKKSSVSTIP